MKIRKANIKDAPFILSLIKELAHFEKASEKVSLTLEQLIQDGFSDNPLFEAIILHDKKDQQVGFGLFYNRYSTWKGKSLYLEDLYIIPEARRQGLGAMAMEYLKQYASNSDCERFEWQVLEWNEPAIKLYEQMGAELDREWVNCRLEGSSLKN